MNPYQSPESSYEPKYDWSLLKKCLYYFSLVLIGIALVNFLCVLQSYKSIGRTGFTSPQEQLREFFTGWNESKAPSR